MNIGLLIYYIFGHLEMYELFLKFIFIIAAFYYLSWVYRSFLQLGYFTTCFPKYSITLAEKIFLADKFCFLVLASIFGKVFFLLL